MKTREFRKHGHLYISAKPDKPREMCVVMWTTGETWKVRVHTGDGRGEVEIYSGNNRNVALGVYESIRTTIMSRVVALEAEIIAVAERHSENFRTAMKEVASMNGVDDTE